MQLLLSRLLGLQLRQPQQPSSDGAALPPVMLHSNVSWLASAGGLVLRMQYNCIGR